jgi:DNA-binding transcriptional ArsR family regulator
MGHAARRERVLGAGAEAGDGMSQQLVSYDLRELRTAGLVAASVEGRSSRYRLSCSELGDLVSLIGRLALAARHAEVKRVPDTSPA